MTSTTLRAIPAIAVACACYASSLRVRPANTGRFPGSRPGGKKQPLPALPADATPSPQPQQLRPMQPAQGGPRPAASAATPSHRNALTLTPQPHPQHRRRRKPTPATATATLPAAAPSFGARTSPSGPPPANNRPEPQASRHVVTAAREVTSPRSNTRDGDLHHTNRGSRHTMCPAQSSPSTGRAAPMAPTRSGQVPGINAGVVSANLVKARDVLFTGTLKIGVHPARGRVAEGSPSRRDDESVPTNCIASHTCEAHSSPNFSTSPAHDAHHQEIQP